MPYRKRKKPHRGIGTAVGAMCPIAPNALWALDFQFDTTVDGRILKLLNVVDEYTRECPAIVVDRSIDADKVVATLDRMMTERGAPRLVKGGGAPARESPYDPAAMSRMVQVATAGDVTEAEELQELLRDAGIDAEIEAAVAEEGLNVLVPESSLEAAQDAIEALSEPDDLIAEP